MNPKLSPDIEKRLEVFRDQVREREHLSFLEEAQLYAHLLAQGVASSQRRLANMLGISQARISQRLALLDMPTAIVALIEESGGAITEHHTRALRRLADPELLVWVAQQITKYNLSVDRTERVIDAMLGELRLNQHRRLRPGSWQFGANYRWRAKRDVLEVQIHADGARCQLEHLENLIPSLRQALLKRGPNVG